MALHEGCYGKYEAYYIGLMGGSLVSGLISWRMRQQEGVVSVICIVFCIYDSPFELKLSDIN